VDAWWVTLTVLPLVIAILVASAVVGRRRPRAEPASARTIRVVWGGVFLAFTAWVAAVAVLGLARREWLFAVLLLIVARMAWWSVHFLRSAFHPKSDESSVGPLGQGTRRPEL
jgi:hypothetical protein